jgi:hypothetical protein
MPAANCGAAGLQRSHLSEGVAERQGFELAISPTGIFAGHLTSILSTGSTEVRRKKPIRERFWSTRPIDQY